MVDLVVDLLTLELEATLVELALLERDILVQELIQIMQKLPVAVEVPVKQEMKVLEIQYRVDKVVVVLQQDSQDQLSHPPFLILDHLLLP
tara:strand:+ start:341 stop:610 length:270 start_codon:yes stop_codon:yes gene_type:complete